MIAVIIIATMWMKHVAITRIQRESVRWKIEVVHEHDHKHGWNMSVPPISTLRL